MTPVHFEISMIDSISAARIAEQCDSNASLMNPQVDSLVTKSADIS